MANLRVFEFAKKHDLPTKKVIEKAKELGINYTSHMSSMEDKQVAMLNETFAANKKRNSPTLTKQEETQKNTTQKGGKGIVNKQNQSNNSAKPETKSKPSSTASAA